MKKFLAIVVALVLIGGGVFLFFEYAPAGQRFIYKLDYEEYIQQVADEYQVNPYWICAVIKCESNYDPEVVSSAGAIGLMQVMQSTAYDLADKQLVDSDAYSPDNLVDPKTNINYGTAYLRYLVERYHEMEPAVAAYNAGLANVDEWLEADENIRNSVAFKETNSYLHSVVEAKEKYEKLYTDAFSWN